MIKVFLVDDEPFIRQGLRVLVDWEQYGYEVVGEAANGAEAIHKLGIVKPNLVFVDVRMPGMSGMEMIAYAREHLSKRMKFVILTGYADFTYAKEAIGLQVREYMLKPVQREELIRILKDMKKEFAREEKNQEQEKRRERLEYDACIAHLLWGKYTERDLAFVQSRLAKEEGWQYISFEFCEREQGFAVLEQERRTQLQNSCMGYLEELLKEECFHVVPLPEREAHIFGVGLLLTPPMAIKRGMQPMEWIAWLRKRICQYFSLEVQVYVGERVETLGRLAQSYHSIRAARCLHNFSLESEPVAVYSEGGRKAGGFSRLTGIDELIELVKDNCQGQIERAVAQIFEGIRESAMSMEVLSANIYHLLYRLMELARELDSEANQEEILRYISRESFEKIALSGDQSELSRFVLDYASYLEQLRQTETRGITEKIDRYVREHYKEKLSLKGLGELFFVNNVYLGQLFKKKYGIPFKEYLNEIRMEEAIRLLEETDLRIYAIAGEVGFANSDYFINKFVQTKGMTPFQYRKKVRKL